jgi:transcriptional regulator with XRE-family HTH domain
MFNKKTFKQLLLKAIGTKTITDYAKETGVNRTYISKYINEKLDSPPTPDIIKRLACNTNEVTYELLMSAAGHLNNTFSINDIAQLLSSDEKIEIEDVLNKLNLMLSNTKNLNFDGKTATKEDIESILDAVKIGIEMAKMKKRRNE